MNAINDVLCRVALALENATEVLNELDAVAGDGDLGLTAAHAATVVKRAAAGPGDDWVALLTRLAADLEREAPSSCGTLLSTGLTDGVRAAASADGNSLVRVATGLLAMAERIRRIGGADVGQRTLLDALVPASTAMSEVLASGGDLQLGLQNAASAADAGALETAQMAPQFGRAAWTPDRALGHEDAGARLIAIIFAGLVNGPV